VIATRLKVRLDARVPKVTDEAQIILVFVFFVIITGDHWIVGGVVHGG
jgi:hypothetical protein